MRGFTLIESLVVTAIFIIFLGLVAINIINVEPKTSLTLTTSTIIADIRRQQLAAMTGTVNNSVASDFGVYLENNRYTLFPGSSYDPSNQSNSKINLPDNITISDIGFPGSVIIFQKSSGEIISGGNTFKITNSITGQVKTVTLNKLGVVTQVQ